jgi:hypothetical protein
MRRGYWMMAVWAMLLLGACNQKPKSTEENTQDALEYRDKPDSMEQDRTNVDKDPQKTEEPQQK